MREYDYEVRVVNLTTHQMVVKHFKTYYEMEEFLLDQKEKHPICEIHNMAPFKRPTHFFFREE